MQQQIVTLVKNSTAQMTVPTLPKTGSIIQTTASIQGQGGKNTIVKLVPGNSKLITAVKTIPSSMLVNKAGKFVLAKNNSGQLSTVGNQQVLVVSSNTGIRTIQTVTNAPAVNVAQAKTTTVNVTPVVSASTVGLQNVKIAGKPITISMPMNVVTSPKTVTLAKNTVGPRLAPNMGPRALNRITRSIFPEAGHVWWQAGYCSDGRWWEQNPHLGSTAGWQDRAHPIIVHRKLHNRNGAAAAETHGGAATETADRNYR